MVAGILDRVDFMWRKEFGSVQYHYAEDPEGISGCDTSFKIHLVF